MLKNDDIKKIFIIEILAFFSWFVICVAFSDIQDGGFYLWGGLIFGVISFVLAGVSLYLVEINSNRNTTEINYIPIYYTILFQIVTIIINTYFIFRGNGNLNVIVVVLNSVAIILFISLRLFTEQYVQRVDEQTIYSSKKIASFTAISVKLSTLISIEKDNEIKKKLLEVKELVDYSSNVSQPFSDQQQNLFLLQLNQIEAMILENREKKDVLNKIEEAVIIWNTRNSTVSAIR